MCAICEAARYSNFRPEGMETSADSKGESIAPPFVLNSVPSPFAMPAIPVASAGKDLVIGGTQGYPS